MKNIGIFSLLLSLGAATLFAASAPQNNRINHLQTDREVTFYQEDNNQVPTYVRGVLVEQVARGAENQAVMHYFNDNSALYKLSDPYSQLQPKAVETDRIGMRHIRYQQLYDGLRIIGAEVTAHISEDGTLSTVNGKLRPEVKINSRPRITADDAIATARADLQSFFGDGEINSTELVVFPWDGTDYLAWRFFIFSYTPMGNWEYFVDANTGRIIFKANRIMNAEEIGSGTGVMGNYYNHLDTWSSGSTYEMRDYTRQLNNNIHNHDGQMADGSVIETYLATTSLPGSVATDGDNVWGGTTYAPAVDGQIYSALFYDWLLRELGRNSFNDNGASMRTSVNYSAEGDNNAYWNGAQIVIWSFSTGWRSLAGSPDVIAHEWGHAVTQYTSGLVYQKESGALNESFSDMIGAAFEFAHDTLDTPDWYMGENGRETNIPFRSMISPHDYGDPDYYGPSDPYWIDVENCTPQYNNDYCGVHTNSGVGNKWFYLLSDGGTHHSVTVTGIGVANAIQIAYRANAYYWNSQTDYANAALGTISAAHDLDPTGVWETAVSDAWTAVGVSTPEPYLVFSYPSGLPETTTPGQSTTFEVQINGVLGGTPVGGTEQLHYSLNGGSYQAVTMTPLGGNLYETTLPAMNCGDDVSFYVSADMNATPSNINFTDPDPGTPYTAVPSNGTVTVYQDDFEANNGWSFSGGSWGRGVPSGGGGEYGYPDPTSGTLGSNVLGYNLSGDYANNIPEYHATSPAIDCSGMDKVHLIFQRWLGVEQPAYDHAYIRVSTDGSTWNTVWENTAEIADNAWVEADVDISAYADNQSTVYIRFTQGTSDGGWRYCGWNIDDLRVVGNQCTGGAALAITTSSLPDWTAGFTYNQQLNATGGSGGYSWGDKNNDLSGTGLTLSSTGLLSGIVANEQVISFTAEVTDGSMNTTEQLYQFTVNPAVSILTPSLPEWTAGMAFSEQLSVTGGTGTVTVSDKNNELTGSGLSLSAAGLLSGSPSVGTYQFTARGEDAIGAFDEQILTAQINPAVTISTSSLPVWEVGVSFDEQLAGGGGTGALTWSDKNNDLSGYGLSCGSTGQVSGTPTTAGSFSFTAELTDAIGAADEQPVAMQINEALSVLTDSLNEGLVDEVYLDTVLINGGVGPFTFVVLNDGLNGTGLSIDNNGVVSGTPTTAMSETITIRIIDNLGVTVDQPLDLTVALPYICGDIDNNGTMDIADILYFVDYMFLSPAGPAPEVIAAADIDGSGAIDVSDLLVYVDFMFADPPGPAPICGTDI